MGSSRMLSIITVVYNNKHGLEKTISSVEGQRKIYGDIEFIVIDGDSTDGTKDLLAERAGSIDVCVSERDNGIYDAMNKGIKAAKGSSLLFLNSGDYFIGSVLDGYVGGPALLPVKYRNLFGKLIDFPLRDSEGMLPNCHQGIIFENKGLLYDSSYRICADYKFYLDQKLEQRPKMLESEGYVFYDSGGISSVRIKERDRELFAIRKEYLGLAKTLALEARPFLKRAVRKLLSMAKVVREE